MNILNSIFTVMTAPFVFVWGALFPEPPATILQPQIVQTTHPLQSRVDQLQSRVEAVENEIDTIPRQLSNLGASLAIPTPIALYEDNLASAITSSQTTMTLVRGTDGTGTSLASSTYGFIIDEGSSSQEFVLADCTGTACTNITRGVSLITGTTTVASLQKAHRRGASVKITDGPVILVLKRVINGEGTFPNIVSYTTHPTFTATTQIVDKKYVDDAAFSGAGVIDATTAARGVVELATQTETASSTATGGSGPLVINNSTATSTFNSATAALRVVVTQNSGKIDNNFIGTSTIGVLPTGSLMAYASTTAPDGWLLANGTAVSRTTYAALFAVVGVSYGAGDGSTTFNLPNLLGRNILMASTTANIGQTGGESNHTLTVAELASHTHTVQVSGANAGTRFANTANDASGAPETSSSAGSNTPHNVLDPYIALQYIIKH